MPNPEYDSQESEISLFEIVNFLKDSWKKLIIAGITGAILGLMGWFFLGTYQSEVVLINNGGTDLISWRSFQKTLPILANQIIDESRVPDGQESLYRTLSSQDWWQKNALATYGMSKSDFKDLASTAGLESAGASIVSFTLKASGPSKQEALDNVRGAKNFLLQGASYLKLKSLFSIQESKLMSAEADIAKKINATQLELSYKQERLKSLETLAKRFPSEQKAVSQVVDLKDSGAKYMPLSTQIIASNTDINDSKEALERLKDAQLQMAVLKVWVKHAEPIVNSGFDGLIIAKKLLEQEASLRATVDPADLKSLAFLDDLRLNLTDIDVRFSKGFEVTAAPTTSKKGMINTAIGGFLGAFFLMLLAILAKRALVVIKRNGVQ